ncbi:hypothetical protein CHU98_g11722 [Xylaria longipes]|nr:hypothetical protein CHU98_g11722 [Xylaria longipes]
MPDPKSRAPRAQTAKTGPSKRVAQNPKPKKASKKKRYKEQRTTTERATRGVTLQAPARGATAGIGRDTVRENQLRRPLCARILRKARVDLIRARHRLTNHGPRSQHTALTTALENPSGRKVPMANTAIEITRVTEARVGRTLLTIGADGRPIVDPALQREWNDLVWAAAAQRFDKPDGELWVRGAFELDGHLASFVAPRDLAATLHYTTPRTVSGSIVPGAPSDIHSFPWWVRLIYYKATSHSRYNDGGATASRPTRGHRWRGSQPRLGTIARARQGRASTAGILVCLRHGIGSHLAYVRSGLRN